MSKVTVIHCRTNQKMQAQVCGGFRTRGPSVLFDWDNNPTDSIPVNTGEWYWIVQDDESMQAELEKKTQDPQTLKHRLDFRK